MAAMVFLLPCQALAHTLWINATEHAPAFYAKFGAQTKTYIGYGHRYPVDDFLPPSQLVEYKMTGPDGQTSDITPATPGGFLAAHLRFKQQGPYLVSVATKPGFYTMYNENGVVHHKIGPKTGLEGVILSLYYEQYAKSLIHVGQSDDKGYARTLGHRLEIIPLEDPGRLKGNGGDTLSVKILFNGKPAQFCKVYATHSGFSTQDDFALATTADSQGIAKIRLTHWGPWLIKANLRLPPTEDLKDKCLEMNYTATLSVAVP